jgi:3-methyl-2-oxobutanoate hydroxymethyltransferase
MRIERAGKIGVSEVARKKQQGEKIVMVTAYDYPFARLVDQSGVDILLVGDSLGMVELGLDTTLPVTMEIMLHHLKAVRRGTQRALLLADMPFLSYQVSADEAVRNAGRLLQEGGAEAVKLEGGASIAATIRRIVDAGMPVMAHLGFTPQSVHQIGVRIQGKDEAGAARLLEDAHAVQEAGAFAVVLELVPPTLAAQITAALDIPTIGIGAGPDCGGQVLVINDLLGLRGGEYVPFRHVKEYAHIGDDILRALRAFRKEVEDGQFPAPRS